MSKCQLFGKPVLALLLTFVCSSAKAQDYVGVLPELIQPETVEILGLSDEQVASIKGVISKRTAGAITLGQMLKEAPIDQKPVLRAKYGRESEEMGLQFLSEKQIDRVNQLRVEWRGMLALSDDAVASKMNLADWQKDMVAEWADRVQRDSRKDTAQKTMNQAQTAIRKDISQSQFAMWQALAGQIAMSEAGEPVPPEQFDAKATIGATETPVDNAELPIEDIRLKLSFQGTPWDEVIRWLAEQADFSLQSDVIPPGAFNFRDRSRMYTISEAMDVMNSQLLSSGHILMKTGRMLRCVNFEEDQEIAGEFINEITEYVTIDELDRFGDYEPVKVAFVLSRLDPDEFAEEIEQLVSIQGTVRSIPSTGEVIVCDMARNVRQIAAMIARAENPDSARGSTIKSFPLKHINAEEVLSVARPLLGLEEEANVSEDIKISTDTFGTTIYATGAADKVQNLKDLVTQMDVMPDAADSPIEIENPVLNRHRVVGVSLQLAYEIVSQLLAGAPDVRLAQDEASKQLVLWARPSEHDLVTKALQEISGESSDFEVIQLKKLDVQLAISAINKFFGISDSEDAESGQPVIDGDLYARQVWVKGTATQVEQIRQFLSDLEGNMDSNNVLGNSIISIPLTGRSAQRALTQAEQLWNQMNNKNRIRFIESPSERRGDTGLEERSFAPNVDEKEASKVKKERAGDSASLSGIPNGRFVGFPQEAPSASDGSPAAVASSEDIMIMQGPSGLIVSSEDTAALARFEAMMRLFIQQAELGSIEPTVIYLKNIKAAAAKELLETVLSGTASSGGGGSLLGDMTSSVFGGFGGGMMGALLGGGSAPDLLGSGDGQATGDYTITADPRLNALIVKANPTDMNLIEQLLQVFDQVESPIAIETQGRTVLIPVVTQDVEDVVNIVKQMYGSRIEGNSTSGGAGGGGRGGGQPNPAEFLQALRGGGRGGRGGGSGQSELAEAKIAVGADTSTNMLIVRAQPQDIEDIRALVNMLDQAGEAEKEEIGYASLDGKLNASVFQDSVSRMLGPNAQTNVSSQGQTTTAGGSSAPGGAGGGAAQTDAQRQAARAAFFERLRAGGAFGGGAGGRGGGPGGATGGRGGAGGGGFGGGRGGFGGGGFGGGRGGPGGAGGGRGGGGR